MDTTTNIQLRPLLLNREQVAEVLGGCSASHVDRLDRAGKLGPRPIKLGGCVRWRADELEAWIAAGCPGRVDWQRMGRPQAGESNAGDSNALRIAK
jgi:predicted DNA-binding transcriptional regulator AlpA